MKPSLEDRFWAKVRKTDTCWLWTASENGRGYGQFWNGEHLVTAHRWLYELTVGPVDRSLDLDHLCRVRTCVRPDHLEPVTRLENMLRGDHPSAVARRNGACKNGHPATDENVYRRKPSGVIAYCKLCDAERRAAPRAS